MRINKESYHIPIVQQLCGVSPDGVLALVRQSFQLGRQECLNAFQRLQIIRMWRKMDTE